MPQNKAMGVCEWYRRPTRGKYIPVECISWYEIFVRLRDGTTYYHLNLDMRKFRVMSSLGRHYMIFVQHEINEYHHHMVSVRDKTLFQPHLRLLPSH